jgi:hypothetical protein
MRRVPQIEWRRWLAPIIPTHSHRRAAQRAWRYYALDASLVHAGCITAHGWAATSLRTCGSGASSAELRLLFGLEAPDGYANLVPPLQGRSGVKKTGIRKRGISRPASSTRIAKCFASSTCFVLSIMPLLGRTAGIGGLPKVEVYEVRDRNREPSWWERRCTRRPGECCACCGADDTERQAVVEVAGLPCRQTQVRRRTSGLSIENRAHSSRLARAAWLLVSPGYYPGWQAEVDGVATPIMRTNG